MTDVILNIKKDKKVLTTDVKKVLKFCAKSFLTVLEIYALEYH